MTVKEKIDKFAHEVEGVLHEVEEVLLDVKENVILSVRDYSLQIAFVLMGVTSAILLIGTVYVWCFHHPKRTHSKNEHPRKESQSTLSDQTEQEHADKLERKDMDNIERKPVKTLEHELAENLPEVENEINVQEKVVEESSLEVKAEAVKIEDDIAGQSEQNGQVRKRITSSSINNNNSPLKSKIPVFNRQKSKNS